MRLFCWRYFFFFKQKTAYEIRISDWSSDVCSSDLHGFKRQQLGVREAIMDLSEVQVLHGNSRSVVGPLECQVGAFEAGQIFSGKGTAVVDLSCRTESTTTFKSPSDIRVCNDNAGPALANQAAVSNIQWSTSTPVVVCLSKHTNQTA